MSQVLNAPSPVATFDEDSWDDLLNFIEERRVIPIIGPELLTVQTENGPQNLYLWLAQKLAVRLGIAASELPTEPSLPSPAAPVMVIAPPFIV